MAGLWRLGNSAGPGGIVFLAGTSRLELGSPFVVLSCLVVFEDNLASWKTLVHYDSLPAVAGAPVVPWRPCVAVNEAVHDLLACSAIRKASPSMPRWGGLAESLRAS